MTTEQERFAETIMALPPGTRIVSARDYAPAHGLSVREAIGVLDALECSQAISRGKCNVRLRTAITPPNPCGTPRPGEWENWRDDPRLKATWPTVPPPVNRSTLYLVTYWDKRKIRRINKYFPTRKGAEAQFWTAYTDGREPDGIYEYHGAIGGCAVPEIRNPRASKRRN